MSSFADLAATEYGPSAVPEVRGISQSATTNGHRRGQAICVLPAVQRVARVKRASRPDHHLVPLGRVRAPHRPGHRADRWYSSGWATRRARVSRLTYNRPGLEALTFCRKTYNERLQAFTDKPVHDWTSHPADAFRGLAVRHKPPRRERPRWRRRFAGREAPVQSGRLGWMHWVRSTAAGRRSSPLFPYTGPVSRRARFSAGRMQWDSYSGCRRACGRVSRPVNGGRLYA